LKGGPIDKINVGNLHYGENKKQITSTVSVSEDDIKVFKKLNQQGIGLEIKGVPSEKGIDLMTKI